MVKEKILGSQSGHSVRQKLVAIELVQVYLTQFLHFSAMNEVID